jgi:hypothetical protein
MAEEVVNIEDFGFSMVSEDDIKASEKAKADKVSDEHTVTQLKLRDLKNRIWPLLEGLKKDPQKDVIKWPNRVTVITRVMKDIEDIIAR